MSLSKKNSALFIYTLLALLVTFMGDFVTAAPIGDVSDSSATIMCKWKGKIKSAWILNGLFYQSLDTLLLFMASFSVSFCSLPVAIYVSLEVKRINTAF